MFWPENSYASSTNPIRTKSEQLKYYEDMFQAISNLDRHFKFIVQSLAKWRLSKILFYITGRLTKKSYKNLLQIGIQRAQRMSILKDWQK